MIWTEARPGARWDRPGRSSPLCRCGTHFRRCFCQSPDHTRYEYFVKTCSGRTRGKFTYEDHHRACSQIRPIMDVLWTQSVMPDNTEHLPFRKYLLRRSMCRPNPSSICNRLCTTSICSSEQVHRPRACRRPAHVRPGWLRRQPAHQGFFGHERYEAPADVTERWGVTQARTHSSAVRKQSFLFSANFFSVMGCYSTAHTAMPFFLKSQKGSVCQDRLGTNIVQTHKQGRLCRLDVAPPQPNGAPKGTPQTRNKQKARRLSPTS